MTLRAMIFVILILSSISPSSAVVNGLSFELVVEDKAGDISIASRDLYYLWMSETDTELFFVINFVGELKDAMVNITLLNDNNENFIIYAFASNNDQSLYITHGESLTGDVVPSNDSFSVQYINKQIYFDPDAHELGFYIDWDDIGGKGTVKLVTWYNRTVNPVYDRMPDSSYYEFTGVQSEDRIINFSNALDGNFDLFIVSISGTDNSTIEYISITTIDKPIDSTPSISFSFILFILLTVLVVFYFRIRKEKPAKKLDSKSTKKSILKPETNVLSSTSGEFKFIPELNRQVRLCCYQTARLKDTYCYCGRAITEDLKSIFEN